MKNLYAHLVHVVEVQCVDAVDLVLWKALLVECLHFCFQYTHWHCVDQMIAFEELTISAAYFDRILCGRLNAVPLDFGDFMVEQQFESIGRFVRGIIDQTLYDFAETLRNDQIAT